MMFLIFSVSSNLVVSSISAIRSSAVARFSSRTLALTSRHGVALSGLLRLEKDVTLKLSAPR